MLLPLGRSCWFAWLWGALILHSREEFDASFDYTICCVLLLHCVPCQMLAYLRLFVRGCVVSALLLCHMDEFCGFQCDHVDGGDYRDGVFDDFVELNHLVLFLRRINLHST